MLYKKDDKVWIENIEHITDAEFVRKPQTIEEVTLVPVTDANDNPYHEQAIFLTGLPYIFTGKDLSPYKNEDG